MTYLKVIWIHSFEDEPTELYSELDKNGWEVRKIEVYRDGSFGIATKEKSFGGTELSLEPLPNVEEIRKDPQFLPTEISKNEFEEIWNQYLAFLKQ